MSRDAALNVTTPSDAMKSRQIFVSIASYRDVYLPFTIDTLSELPEVLDRWG